MSKIFDLEDFYQQINQTPTSEDNAAGHFDIFRINDMALSRGRAVSHFRRSFYKITLITGENIIDFADKRIAFSGTALVFTSPSIPYVWERIGTAHQGYMCIFNASFLNRHGNINDFPVFLFTEAALVPIHDEAIQKFTDLFESLYLESRGTYLYKYELLRIKTAEIIHEAQKIHINPGYLNSAPNAAHRIAGLFAQLLEQQFPIELKYQVIRLRFPSDFAVQLNIHVNHLNKALKETTGQNTSPLINDRIIEEAQILLSNTDWTVAEIAFSLGFEEPNNFSSFFKSRTKYSPKGFRSAEID